jgi:hypothetical protein
MLKIVWLLPQRTVHARWLPRQYKAREGCGGRGMCCDVRKFTRSRGTAVTSRFSMQNPKLSEQIDVILHQKLTDVMRLFDITTKIMQRLCLLQPMNANGCGQGSALAKDKHYVRVSPEMARYPNGISKSRCCVFRFAFRKESDLW